MLCIEKLSFSFGNFEILKNLSLDLAKGEIGTLIGSSGSGKTTLFKLLTGILEFQEGTLSIDGEVSSDAYRHVSYMMQEELLLPWRTVLDNLMIVGELGKQKNDITKMQQEAKFYLNEMGLKGWEDAYPDQLSGGMKQRVSLARTLLQQRPLLLLDEPFAALDVGLREHMHDLLQDVRKKYGTTILMVTHDFRDAISLSDRIFILSKGKIEQEWKLENRRRHDPQAFHQLNEELLASIKKNSQH